MDFANRGNRPGQQTRPTDNQPAQSAGENRSFEPKTSKSPGGGKFDLSKIGAIALLVIVCLLVVSVLAGLVFVNDGSRSESDLIDETKYQAVFLNSQDGQVYFGKLDIYNKDLYNLTDIYYVRVNQQVQPGSETPTQNISLAKLGAELHCPYDQMFIARDQVLYWENIQDEGQVVSAIKEYQESGEKVECNTTNAANQQQQQTGNASGTAPAGSEEANQNDTDTTGTEPEETTAP